jgi:hypothetical protein
MAWRAFWFAARDAAADLLRGIGGAEEAADIPPERFMGVVEEEVAHTPPAAATTSAPTWTNAELSAKMPKLRAAVDAGKTADELIAFYGAKKRLTPEQEAAIRALKPTEPAQAEPPAGAVESFVAEMEAASEGGVKQ